MACNGPLFGLFYFSSSVEWDLFLEVSQNVLRFIFIMKLNQNNIVFAWSFADFGALSDSLTDCPNHHWYHHVDTLLVLGWWLADPRWCSSKVSFWCWQVLIHSRFWSVSISLQVRYVEKIVEVPAPWLFLKKKGWHFQLDCLEENQSYFEELLFKWLWANLTSGSIQLVIGNTVYQFQSTCCLVIQEHCYIINQEKSDIPLIFTIYGPFRSFSALRKCIPRRSQGDQKPFLREPQRNQM